MNGRGLPTAVGGFMQGYEFVDRMERREDQAEYRDEKREREKERWNMERQEWQERREAREARQQALKEQERAKRVQRAAKAVQHEIEEYGQPRPGTLQTFAEASNVDLASMTDPAYQKSLQTLESVAKGEMKLNDPEALEALNTTLKPRIDANVGEKLPDGREIVSKEIVRAVPNPDGDGVMFELSVYARNKDGEIEEYKAPVTEGRGGAPDEMVMEVPIDNLVKNLKGQKILHQFVSNDKLRPVVDRAIIMSGGELKDAPGPSYTKLSKGQQLLDEEGNVVAENRDTGSGSGDGLPAEARLMEYLVDNGVAQDRSEAYAMARSARFNPVESATRLAQQLAEEQEKQGIYPEDEDYKSPEALRDEALEMVMDMHDRYKARFRKPRPGGRKKKTGKKKRGARKKRGSKGKDTIPENVAAQAREALQSGADPEAVAKRLLDMGYSREAIENLPAE